MNNFKTQFLLLLVVSFMLIFESCSDNGSDPEPEFDCSESTLSLTAEVTHLAGCFTEEGSISVTGTGGEGNLMYSLNDGPLQASTSFGNLGPGQYTVKLTDDTECSQTITVRVMSGISFETEIKPIVENSCAIPDCHDGSSTLPNFLVFSNFQNRAEQVKSRTQSGDMPRTGSLTDDEKAKIACWVDDGALDN